jgi:hypothetical protein
MFASVWPLILPLLAVLPLSGLRTQGKGGAASHLLLISYLLRCSFHAIALASIACRGELPDIMPGSPTRALATLTEMLIKDFFDTRQAVSLAPGSIRPTPKTIPAFVALILMLCGPLTAAELEKKTSEAYDAYLTALEQQIDREQAGQNFLWGNITPQEEKLRAGEVLIEKAKADKHSGKVPDGLVHHWTGFIFIPKVDISRVFSFLQDYDHHADYYKPEVARSKLLRRDGGHFVAYMRFVKKKVITVVLDTEHDVEYKRVDAQRAYSRSHTTRVNEVESPNEPNERLKPAGQGGGYMWRMDTYWRYLEKDGGVYVRCDAVSLTRDVPTGLGWLIGPFITSIPKDSLFHTLNSTRVALTRP